jgi:hypothetical protein
MKLKESQDNHTAALEKHQSTLKESDKKIAELS